MHTTHESQFINAFNLISGIGPKNLHKLSHHFNSFEDAWNASEKEFLSTNLFPSTIQSILKNRDNIDVEKEWQKCTKENIFLLSILDKNYPKNLKNIPDPPFCLYVRGNIDILHKSSVAIVGSRKISEYGKNATTALAGGIAEEGITIISGLALGTDATAHRTALEVQGTTIAILGGGINDTAITPRTNLSLAKDILAQNGTIISEYPYDTMPNHGTFPTRNRLMAGLSDAVIIIEATKKSGTLITAKYASTYKKLLFALPGSIFSDNALGPNTLIQKNVAKPILCSNDVLQLFDKKEKKKQKNITFTNKNHKMLYEIIAKHPDGIHINHIIKESNMDTNTISSTLTLLEIDDLIKNIGNQIYIVKK
ncbi:MAG: DNA-protecting protein DprA [Candidatus Moraniibacteriota bacterium]|nr:MAG: DNA-protecting protein DprA [Candidatus Moranbacteria bacterium]